MIEELKRNVNTEIEMLREISSYLRRLDSATEDETKLLFEAINSLEKGMKIINDSIPDIVKETSKVKRLPTFSSRNLAKGVKLERINFKRTGSEIEVVLKSEDREKFIRELDINEQFIKKLKRGDKEDREKFQEFKASRGYLKLANKLFLETSRKYVKKGYFRELAESLRKANIDMLFESYVAMVILTVSLSVVFSVLLTCALLFFDTLPIWPFFEIRAGGYFTRFLSVFWVLVGVPILVFLGLYFYPTTEKKSIEKKIDQELPFAVIHMSAISGSGIAPSEIFRIIGLNKEYPYLRREIRKVLNQINLYGYDLTTALNNAAKTAPSEHLAELLSGLSTTITSGANLSEFFEKRAETLLLGYRLEREKYTHLVETFLDIYISIVIAAPMIFLLLLVMMAISGIRVGLTPVQLSLLAVSTISLLNIVFLVILHMKQPSY